MFIAAVTDEEPLPLCNFTTHLHSNRQIVFLYEYVKWPNNTFTYMYTYVGKWPKMFSVKILYMLHISNSNTVSLFDLLMGLHFMKLFSCNGYKQHDLATKTKFWKFSVKMTVVYLRNVKSWIVYMLFSLMLSNSIWMEFGPMVHWD